MLCEIAASPKNSITQLNYIRELFDQGQYCELCASPLIIDALCALVGEDDVEDEAQGLGTLLLEKLFNYKQTRERMYVNNSIDSLLNLASSGKKSSKFALKSLCRIIELESPGVIFDAIAFTEQTATAILGLLDGDETEQTVAGCFLWAAFISTPKAGELLVKRKFLFFDCTFEVEMS